MQHTRTLTFRNLNRYPYLHTKAANSTTANILLLGDKTSILSILTCVILLNPKYQGRVYRSFRAYTFMCTGFSALAPLAHGALLFGISDMLRQSGLPFYLLEGSLHILGVFFYTVSMLLHATLPSPKNTTTNRHCISFIFTPSRILYTRYVEPCLH